MKKYVLPVIMLAVFETVAITLWLTKDNIFLITNCLETEKTRG